MDRMGRTDGDALTAEAALGVVDVGEIVGDGDGFELTLLEAEGATDTRIATSLLSDAALILVDTADEDTSAFGAFLSELDDGLRASLDTGTAGHTLILEDDGEAGLWVHVHGIEVTRVDAVSHAETAPATVGVPLVEGGGDGAATSSVVDVGAGSSFASAVASDDGDQRILLLSSDAENAADLLHDGCSPDGAEETFEGLALTTSASEGGTTREATASAVRLRQDISDLCDARVFLDFELPRDEVEQESSYRSDKRQDDDRNIHRERVLFVVRG